MKYYSLENKLHSVSFSEAVTRGLAPDGSLYMPEQIPVLSRDFISRLHSLSQTEIAFAIAQQFMSSDFSDHQIKEIVESSFDMNFPLVEIEQDVYSLELFHGPTLAFKDVGARFLANVLRKIGAQHRQTITVLVATSGDTGSAVAHGFYNVENTEVVILYPKDKVSNLQEKQMAALGGNIRAIKINGTFDDCQRIVKQAFQDNDIRNSKFLTSANSINIARLIPQSFYYFLAWSRLPNRERVVFSVPSGNFGNLTAGVLAKKMGLPIDSFIASTNINDVVPQYLSTEMFTPRTSQQTISNAMDVGNPSNFTRLAALYENKWQSMLKDIHGFSFTDEQTSKAIHEVFTSRNYTLDPHGAIGYLGLKQFMQSSKNTTGVFLETAHPSKFPEVVEQSIGEKITIAPALLQLMNKPVVSEECSADFFDFKNILLK